MVLHQHGAHQPDQAVIIGKDPDHPFPAAQLFVQPLNAVGRPQALAVGFRQGIDRCDLIKAFIEQRHGLGGLVLILLDELLLTQFGLFEVGRIVQIIEGGLHRRLQLLGRLVQQVSREMGLAALPAGAVKLLLDRLLHPAVVVVIIDAGRDQETL